MKLSFEGREEKAFPGFKGGEGTLYAVMTDHANGKIIQGRLEKGSSIGMHTHEGTTETITVLKGKGVVTVSSGEEFLNAGDVTFCDDGESHSLRNDEDEDLFFVGVVSNVSK